MTQLSTDSKERKNTPMARGVLDYFPAALAAVARVSQSGNDKHNAGQDLHHARGKSMDHADAIMRHLVDRGTNDVEDGLPHSAKVAWRSLALLQEELEQTTGAPLPRGARKESPARNDETLNAQRPTSRKRGPLGVSRDDVRRDSVLGLPRLLGLTPCCCVAERIRKDLGFDVDRDGAQKMREHRVHMRHRLARRSISIVPVDNDHEHAVRAGSLANHCAKVIVPPGPDRH